MLPNDDPYRAPEDWPTWDFAQKVRWRCKNPSPGVDYATLVDKHLVKDVVRPFFPVTETYCVARVPVQIDHQSLPACYVMKATHRWNRSMLVVGNRFRGMNRTARLGGRYASNFRLRNLARMWLLPDILLRRREVHYRFVRPGILFEEYIEPVDYELQFFLFSGVCRITTVIKRHFHHYRGGQYRLYDEMWHRLEPGSEEGKSQYDNSPEETPYPGREVFLKLEQLCKHIDHVRVDFLASRGQLYFSEFTFTHNAGSRSILGNYESQISRHWPDVKST